jgi:D-3-phosphoglycerate dehydrogenase
MPPFKIALVDLNGHPGVPDWVRAACEQAGVALAAQDCRTADEVAACAHDADVIWVWGSRVVSEAVLAGLPRCGGLIRTGSGTDNLPVPAASARGIVVANTPTAHSQAVAEQAIALLFALLRRIVPLDRATRAGQWQAGQPWPNAHLHGQTLGLVGYGHAARLVRRKLAGFELNVLAHDPFVSPAALAADGVRAVADLEALLAEADFVSLHCPLTPETRGLIGEAQLRAMKPSAFLINTARGPVVDEAALLRALTQGWIAGAGLDVFAQEPAPAGHPLFALDNVVVAPHVAGYSDEHLELSWRLSLEAALDFAAGRWPRSVVNRGVRPRWALRERDDEGGGAKSVE